MKYTRERYERHGNRPADFVLRPRVPAAESSLIVSGRWELALKAEVRGSEVQRRISKRPAQQSGSDGKPGPH